MLIIMIRNRKIKNVGCGQEIRDLLVIPSIVLVEASSFRKELTDGYRRLYGMAMELHYSP